MDNQEVEGQEQDEGLSPGKVIVTFVCFANDLIDFVNPEPISSTILNILTLAFVFGYKIMRGGFSFSTLFCGVKQVIFLLVEQVPIIGNIFPGWLLYQLVGKRKKKAPSDSEETSPGTKPKPNIKPKTK